MNKIIKTNRSLKKRLLLASIIVLFVLLLIEYTNMNASAYDSYNVIFDTKGGSSIATINVRQDRVYAFDTPTKSGYDFAGWYKDSDCTRAYDTLRNLAYNFGAIGYPYDDETRTLYAKWTPATFTINYDAQGGTVSKTSGTVTYGAIISNLPIATKTGYIFGGWFTGTGGSGTQIDEGSTVNLTAGQTLYANWLPITYTVYYDAQGGSCGITSTTVTNNSAYGTLPTPTKTGYTFGGWFTGTGGGGTQITAATTVNITANQTLYAKWTANSYTVSYDAQGGTVSPASATVTYAATYGTLPTPTKPGYAFNGWFTDTYGGGTQITSATPVTAASNQTLYAYWTSLTVSGTPAYKWEQWSTSSTTGMGYTLYSSPNSSTGVDAYTERNWYNSYSVDRITGAVTYYNPLYCLPNEAYSKGYYYAPMTGPSQPTTVGVITGLKSPYGNANPIDYYYVYYTSITYNVKGSSFSGYVYGSAGSYPSNGDQSGYWYVLVGESISNVTFESNGGTVVPMQQVYNGSKVIQPSSPTKIGYTFGGWFSDAGFATPWNFAVNTVGTTNQTLYAKWTANTYTVSYDAQGGTVSPTSATVTYAANYGTLPTPAKTGYTFGGWFTGTGGGGTQITAATTVNITASQTLYAKWTINQYTVTFDSNGGSSVAAVTRDIASQITKPTAPIRTGYTFVGWYSDAGLTNAVTWPMTMGASNVTLYAAWTINQYTVSFVSNGGSAVAAVTQDFASQITEPTAPIRTGYTFAGWYSDAGLTSAVTWPMTMGATNKTLYAAWTINQYTVSFDSNGGSAVAAVTQDFASQITAPTAPIRTGYTFTGWYSDAGLTSAVTWPMTMGAANQTLYAAWTINQYTVTFDSNGGSAVAAVTQDFASQITEPTVPIRTGYTFAGWYSDAGLTSAVTWPMTLSAANQTLYAAWTINQYTVTFNSNGGSAVAVVMQDFASQITEPTAPLRTGYTFTGWYSDAGLTSVVTWPMTMGAGNVTLYAAWTINQYTVSFDSNGGSAVAAVTQDFASQISAPTAPTRTGYTFAGWYSDAGLTSAVTWPMTMGASNMTLYAAWTINQYTVSFNSNGGSEVAPISQNFGSQITEPAAPTKTGYTFAGWYSDSSLTSAVTWPMTMGAANVTLYAAWMINQYTVSFDSNGGSDVAPISQDFGSQITEPAAPTRTGYSFGGWYNDAELTNATTWPRTMGAVNVTYYAAWTTNLYTVSFDTNGGSVVAPVAQEYGSSITEPAAPIKTGYTFSGWFNDAELTNATTWPMAMGAVNATYYAAWTINLYTVSFNSNGGSDVSPISQNFDSQITEPAAPTRTGYSFAGWYSDAELTNAVSWPMTIGTSNMTLYAKWTANKYVVVFYSNGGSEVNGLTLNYGSLIAEPTQPTRVGATFSGWYRDANLTTPATWPITLGTEDMALYAKWNVTPVYSGGDMAVGKTIIISEVSSPLFEQSSNLIAVSAKDSAFSDSVEVKITNSDVAPASFCVSTADQVYSFDISVYISGTNKKTEPVPGYIVTITLPIPENLLGQMSQIDVIHKSDTGVVTTLPSQLEQIDGVWCVVFEATEFSPYALVVRENATNSTTPDSPVPVPTPPSDTPANNQHVVVPQKANTSRTPAVALVTKYYVVTFNSNGGSMVAPVRVSDGGLVNTPTDPTKTGYTFGSWFLDADKTVPVTWPITVQSSLTLYATWTPTATAAHPAPSTPVQLPNIETVTEPTTSFDSDNSGFNLSSLLHGNSIVWTALIVLSVICASAAIVSIVYAFITLINRRRFKSNI